MNGTKILVDPFLSGDEVINTIRLFLISLTVITGIYGLITNSLIFYFIHVKPKINYQRAFNRSILIDRFIQSLALSDVLCCAISLPIYANEIFINFMDTDEICKVGRYVMIFFGTVTAMNYLFIGIERYLGVFHPLKLPSTAVCERCLILAWILGGMVTGLPIPTYVIQHYKLNNVTYTCICDYNKSYQFLFASFLLLGYIIPSIILITTCILIWKFIRSRKATVPIRENSNSSSDSKSVRSNNLSSRYRMTSMFVSLIFAFITPYIVFTVYSSVIILLKLRVSFHIHYTTRMVSAVVFYGNSAIGPSIMFYNNQYLKRKLSSLIKGICCVKTTHRIENIAMRDLGDRNRRNRNL